MFTSLADATQSVLGVSHNSHAGRKSPAPVHRHSRAAGREGMFWRGTSRQDVKKIVLAARRYELTGRNAGSRNGPLGSVAIEVLELLTNLVNFKTGRLDPSIETIMRYLKRSRDAIVRALKALRTHGFLDWLRRYVPTNSEGRGPKVQQTSNAYRLSLPARAMRLLGRLYQASPPPDDFAHAKATQLAAIEAHERSLSLTELPLFRIEDEGLAQALSRLGALIEQRESAKRTESHTKILI